MLRTQNLSAPKQEKLSCCMPYYFKSLAKPLLKDGLVFRNLSDAF